MIQKYEFPKMYQLCWVFANQVTYYIITNDVIVYYNTFDGFNFVGIETNHQLLFHANFSCYMVH